MALSGPLGGSQTASQPFFFNSSKCVFCLVWTSWAWGLSRAWHILAAPWMCCTDAIFTQGSLLQRPSFKFVSQSSELLFVSQHWAAKSLKHRAAAAHLLMLTPSDCQDVTHAFPDRWPLSLCLGISNSLWSSWFYCWAASCLKFSSPLLRNGSFHCFNPKSFSVAYLAQV